MRSGMRLAAFGVPSPATASHPVLAVEPGTGHSTLPPVLSWRVQPTFREHENARFSRLDKR
jgi:hypothetical protein